jgi:nucleoside phosphorylase
MINNVRLAFERLMVEIKEPEVEGNWQLLHEQQVRELRSLFEELLKDDIQIESIYAIVGKADRLIYNLPEKRQRPAGAALTELKYYADQLNTRKSHTLPARVVPLPRSQENEEIKWWKHDVLVVCALHDPELETFLHCLGNYEEHVGQIGAALSGWTYFTSNLPLQHNPAESLSIVALSLDKTGMVDCAALTVECIRHFSPRLVAMTGVCAGRGRMGVKIGDLIIPSGVFTYDTGKYTDSGFEKEPRWCSTGHAVMNRVKIKAGDILREIADDFRRGYGEVSDVKFHTDIMACGSAVIDSEGLLDEIADTHRKVVGLDMESYALLRATELIDQRISGLIVKGVMDLSTGKTDSHKLKSSLWAARFLVKFLASEFPILVRGYEKSH